METALGRKYAMTAPHRISTMIGRDILEAGGSAIEAMVAAAASIAVAYPHMNGIGGDAFWTIKRPGEDPVVITGCGAAAGLATPDWYAGQGHGDALPSRGPLAAMTVPGAVSSWQAALDLLPKGHLGLQELVAPAVRHAREGVAISRHQALMTEQKIDQLRDVPGFSDIYLQDGLPPKAGAELLQTALGATLEQIGHDGPDSFYRGDLAARNCAFLERVGSPLRAADFANHRAQVTTPLMIKTRQGTLYSMVPPTQGMASLAILGVFDRLDVQDGEGFAHVHGLVEAVKAAYRVRNAELGDPAFMRHDAQSLLSDDRLDTLADGIDMARAQPWPHLARDGDTIWMGAVDADGTVVSFIQSVFWEFGSGLVCPDTGVLFQNRGADFSLTAGPNMLAPGKLPFHTLNPALAVLSDGRVMSYGTQGGEGQPQTQSAIFTRYATYGTDLQDAIKRPRWLLGKAWGEASTTLKLEADFDASLIAKLKAAGHEVEIVAPCNGLMGHAGAVVHHPDGMVEAATDPRSDGAAYAV